jgi:hypothetical protein
MVIRLVVGVAAAQGADRPRTHEEIVVYGEQLVDQARDDVVERLEELGYDSEVVDRGNYVVYRSNATWTGEVLLHDDGWVRVKRQPVRVEGRKMPWARTNTPGAWAGCFVWPWLCVRFGGASVSHRKWQGVQTRTTDAIDPLVRTLGDRVADVATAETVEELPARLEALWERGVPLEGKGQVATYPERRAAMVDFWASRTDTVWGEEVRRAVEAFVFEVVQSSAYPFTEAELEEIRALREEPATEAAP